nr:hypothetical protein [Tanacetum cinerariifolium]
MFTRSIVIQRRVEDLQLGVKSYQKKLNLTKPDTYKTDLKCKEAYTAYSNPKRFIYQNKHKQNRDDDKLYEFKEGDLKRLRIQDIEDMMFTRSIVIQRRVEDLQLGVKSYQKKLNLTKPDTYKTDLKCKEAYTAYSNPKGFIYQNKHKQNRLMCIDELHKFSDGTLNDVQTALDDRLKGIQMKYLPQTIWKRSDKERAAAMI